MSKMTYPLLSFDNNAKGTFFKNIFFTYTHKLNTNT
jgi:hypothetical protein